MDEPQAAALAVARRMRDKFRITGITCARTIRSPTGDVTVSFTGSFQGGDDQGEPLTLGEAKTAAYILGLQADVAAIEASVAGQGLLRSEGQDRIKESERRFSSLVMKQGRQK